MNIHGAIAMRWSRLLEIAERRLPALTRLKQAEPLPITLHGRRIYVLPTAFGLVFSVMLLVMLLGALNYNNNPAMLLTCLLGAASYQSVFQAFRTLDRTSLTAVQADTCFAGQALRLSLYFHNDRRPRRALRLALHDQAVVFDLTPQADVRVQVEIPAPRRGWQPIGRMRVWSDYPFGMFLVWSWLNPEVRALIYPHPEANAPPPPFAASSAERSDARHTGDELAALRSYRSSDALRLIAWKASARHDMLLVKEFEQRRGHDLVLDWNDLPMLGEESRISRLTRWVCEADSAQLTYELRLPGQRFGPNHGAEHRHTCLRALALLPSAHT